MGVVYRGRDESLERDVAVKVVSVGDADEEALARFRREAKAAGRLQHPNIVTVYEFGQHEGRPFMALELLEGLDLQHAIADGLKPDARATLPIVLQVLAGLGHAHEHGVVHRDVKPSNVFLPRGRPAKLMDFGIARLGGSTGVGFTTAGMVVGTPNYMSPEQATGAAVDGRSDLFSVGLIVYELVTGERAYAGDSVVSVLFKIVHQEPDLRLIPSGSQWQSLRDVVKRALAKKPDERFPDAHAMGAELQAAVVALGGTVDLAAPSELALMPRATLRTSVIREVGTHRAVPEPEALAPEPLPAEVAQEGTVPRSALAAAAALVVMALGLAGGGLFWLMRPAPVPFATPGPTASVAATTAPVVATTLPTAAPSSTPVPTPTKVVASPGWVAPTPASPQTDGPTPEPSATIATAGGSTERHIARANELMDKGRYAQALEEARAVLRDRPDNQEARDLAADAEAAILIEDSIKKARAALAEGRKDDALEYIRRGLTANPSEGRLLALFREATQ
jgi:serine/threonine-protein kinase